MARTNRTWTSKIGILQFARAYLGLRLYPWQRKILLAIEAGYPVAALVCNNGGKKTAIIVSTAPNVFFHLTAENPYSLSTVLCTVNKHLPPAAMRLVLRSLPIGDGFPT